MLYQKKETLNFNIWPCFVDVLSSLLIVVIFAIIGSFISQVYLSTMLNNTDVSLKILQNQFTNLQSRLAYKEQEIQKLLKEIQQIQNLFNLTKSSETKLKIQNFNLNSQISELINKINTLNSLIEKERCEFSEKEKILKEDMNKTITDKISQLNKLQQELSLLKEQIPASILQNPELLKYRSEFFGTLQEILGGRSDIRPVGDRFVFQSEVLFKKGSAELEANGKAVLDTLANILKEISKKIPSQINWILRVDGHTDKLPIHNDYFDSNWELSSARATCVVKYLINKGISPKNLAAAGFAEYYPLTNDPHKIAKNRRIEFRFDQQ